MFLHTSVACFGDTLASLALALTTMSGFIGVAEYPHFGICIDKSVTTTIFKALLLMKKDDCEEKVIALNCDNLKLPARHADL